ncbi:MAG: hypothetical protein NWR36_06170, partial [Opitutales bacterium]|nr:hypothetical protein [Opitutales bacterium]
MKTVLTFFVFALSLFFIGCASTSKRIDQNEALLKTYTPGEQRMIRTGQIAVGFDQDMVRMALGDPSREATVDTAAGKQVAWEYREIKPSLGVSLGGGIGTRGSGVGIGTGVG